MPKTDLRNAWATRIREFRTSGQSAAAWCRVNDVKQHQLHYWLGREKSAEPASWLPNRFERRS